MMLSVSSKRHHFDCILRGGAFGAHAVMMLMESDTELLLDLEINFVADRLPHRTTYSFWSRAQSAMQHKAKP